MSEWLNWKKSIIAILNIITKKILNANARIA